MVGGQLVCRRVGRRSGQAGRATDHSAKHQPVKQWISRLTTCWWHAVPGRQAESAIEAVADAAGMACSLVGCGAVDGMGLLCSVAAFFAAGFTF